MNGASIDSANLWLKQSGQEERMLCEFDGFNASVFGVGSDREPVGNESLDVGRRQTKVAPVKSGEGLAADNIVHPSTWNSGHGALLGDQTAAQSIDDQSPFASSAFRVIRVDQAGYIASELDDRVLKASARSHERLPRRSRTCDCCVHRTVIAIRAARDDPQAVCS